MYFNQSDCTMLCTMLRMYMSKNKTKQTNQPTNQKLFLVLEVFSQSSHYFGVGAVVRFCTSEFSECVPYNKEGNPCILKRLTFMKLLEKSSNYVFIIIWVNERIVGTAAFSMQHLLFNSRYKKILMFQTSTIHLRNFSWKEWFAVL